MLNYCDLRIFNRPGVAGAVLDIFTPQNEVLRCRTEGSFPWESTFTFIWVDDSALSIDEDYFVTFVNTPSLEKL